MSDSNSPHPPVRAGWRSKFSWPIALALLVTALGLLLRVEHALTFDGVRRGSDYNVHIAGVHWMLEHKRPFYFAPDLSPQVGYQAPLWYALGAVVLAITGHDRAIAFIAVVGWLLRQSVLGLILLQAAKKREDQSSLASWGALAALAISAFLPISVLTDGKLNPEGLNATCIMLACYPLWRMERQAVEEHRIRIGSAIAFGLLSGIALLTKATGIVLWFGAGILFLFQALRIGKKLGIRALWRRLVLPVLASATLFALVASVWVGPNLKQYGHPFPHAWHDMPQTEPLLYRRPLGWALPFDWAPYLKYPVIRSPTAPRPNFWSVLVTGTWSDWYNRGICRLEGGGPPLTDVWGYSDPVWGGPFWAVSRRCMNVHRRVLIVGLFLTVCALLALVQVTRSHLRSDGQRGSLVLPALIVMEIAFVLLFALTYPFDWGAVLNPRYLLPATVPISACLGIALMQMRGSHRLRNLAHAAVLLSIALVGCLVVFQRFGG